MSGLWLVSYIALWILFLVVAVVLISVLRNLGIIYESLRAPSSDQRPAPSSLTTGQRVPEVTWRTLAGHAKTVSEMTGVRQAFALVSPDCAPCLDYMKELSEGTRDLDPLDSTLRDWVVVSIGDHDGTARLAKRAGIPANVQVLVDSDRQVVAKWGISRTPSLVIVDEQLRVVRQIFSAEMQSDSHEPAARILT
jgi:hypothetical protein